MPVKYIRCKKCGVNPRRSKGRYKNGTRKLGRHCDGCRHSLRTPEERKRVNRRQELRKRPWLLHRKDNCERCGFVPVDMCQLDVDHIDGNKDNNDPSNYLTLCANCHRLKTQMMGDHLAPGHQQALRDVWKQGELFN